MARSTSDTGSGISSSFIRIGGRPPRVLLRAPLVGPGPVQPTTDEVTRRQFGSALSACLPDRATPVVIGVAAILSGEVRCTRHPLRTTTGAGFTPLEAIRIGTLNGATFLGRANRAGSIAIGKDADLVVINGDPSTRISDIRNVQMVFKQGVAYDPAKLIESVRGKVGLF